MSEVETVKKWNCSIDKANDIVGNSLLLNQEKLKHEKIQTCLEKNSNLETHLMSTEEKLCVIEDKTCALAHLYSKRIETLTSYIDEQKLILGELM